MFSDGVVLCYHCKNTVNGFDIESEHTDSKKALAQNASTLEVVLKKLSDFPLRIYFDLKQDSLELIDECMKVVGEVGLTEEEIIVGSRSEDKLKYLKKNYKVTVLGLLQDPDKYEEFFKMGGDIYRLWEKGLTKERVEAIHKLGGKVWVTPGHKATATEPRTAGQASKEKLEWFTELKVDGVILNDPSII